MLAAWVLWEQAMEIERYARAKAAQQFSALIGGRKWKAAEMGLFDVRFTGWPEGAIPERLWLPISGISAREAAALALGITPTSIRDVERLSPEAEARIEVAMGTKDWRSYYGDARVSDAAGGDGL